MRIREPIDPDKTPVRGSAWGEFLRHQTTDDPRQETPTLTTCPFEGCKGGTLRKEIETPTRYSVQIDTCPLCKGVGAVLPRVAAEWRRNR
jgi:hypothetical protein